MRLTLARAAQRAEGVLAWSRRSRVPLCPALVTLRHVVGPAQVLGGRQQGDAGCGRGALDKQGASRKRHEMHGLHVTLGVCQGINLAAQQSL